MHEGGCDLQSTLYANVDPPRRYLLRASTMKTVDTLPPKYPTVRKLARWLRRGGVPLGKDHKPLVERPHTHPRSKRRPK